MTSFPRLYEDKESENGSEGDPLAGMTDEEIEQSDKQIRADANTAAHEMVEWVTQGQNSENLTAAKDECYEDLSSVMTVAAYDSGLAPLLLALGGGKLLNTLKGLAFEMGYKAGKTDGR